MMSDITLTVLPTNEQIVTDPINSSHAILEVARDAAAKAEENIVLAESAIQSAANALNYKNAAEQAVASTLVFRNKIINGDFRINQRGVSGTVTLAAGEYGHDRWKAGASGCTYTFSTVNNVTTLNITAGSLVQVIEGINIQSGTHVLSWQGTAQGKCDGSYANSGFTFTATGGANTAVEFGVGTLSNVQVEKGSFATAFEHRPITIELMLCKRYCRLVGNNIIGMVEGPTTVGFMECWDIPMRIAPLKTSVISGRYFTIRYHGDYSIQNPTIANVTAHTTGVWLQVNNCSGLNVGVAVYSRMNYSDNALFLLLDAEL